MNDSSTSVQETKVCYLFRLNTTGRIRVVGQGRTRSISKTFRAVTRRRKPSKMRSLHPKVTWLSTAIRLKLRHEYLRGFRVRKTWSKNLPTATMFTPSLRRRSTSNRSQRKIPLKGSWVRPASLDWDTVLAH